MDSVIKQYDTYADIVADVSNLGEGQVVSADDTERLYRIVNGAIEPITNGAHMELSGTTLTITF